MEELEKEELEKYRRKLLYNISNIFYGVKLSSTFNISSNGTIVVPIFNAPDFVNNVFTGNSWKRISRHIEVPVFEITKCAEDIDNLVKLVCSDIKDQINMSNPSGFVFILEKPSLHREGKLLKSTVYLSMVLWEDKRVQPKIWFNSEVIYA